MYKFKLAGRYLFKRPISYLALLTVALCVFIVVVVMTVMAGLVSEFKEKNHEFVGDAVVVSDSMVGFGYYEEFLEILGRQDYVKGSSAVISTYGLLSPEGSDRSYSIEVMGVDTESFSEVSSWGKSLHYHEDPESAFEPTYDKTLPGCVIGISRWFIRDSQGEYVYSASPDPVGLRVSVFPLTPRGTLARGGTDMVNTRVFWFSDVSHTGLAQRDDNFVYIPFDQAQVLAGMSEPVRRANSIHIKFVDGVGFARGSAMVRQLWEEFAAGKSGEDYAYLLDNVRVQSWREYMRSVIVVMEKEQTLMTFMFAMVGVFTVFIVFVVFYMMINRKTKDIGIMKSLGVGNGAIGTLFGVFALLIGVIGSAAGMIGAIIFLSRINEIEGLLFEKFNFQLWDRTVYAIGDIPNQLEITVLGVIFASALAACLTGAYFPVRRALKLEPVELLQVNDRR